MNPCRDTRSHGCCGCYLHGFGYLLARKLFSSIFLPILFCALSIWHLVIASEMIDWEWNWRGNFFFSCIHISWPLDLGFVKVVWMASSTVFFSSLRNLLYSCFALCVYVCAEFISIFNAKGNMNILGSVQNLSGSNKGINVMQPIHGAYKTRNIAWCYRCFPRYCRTNERHLNETIERCILDN